ncbi:DUF4253 domain-containing protein [Streptomyces sp. NPDC046332]|uniref:DUF4253 domain-containing protein n=1 Tax=Streptomyces sp. NPDC046332 TaxID=3155133 RepID=UPI0033F3B8B8
MRRTRRRRSNGQNLIRITAQDISSEPRPPQITSFRPDWLCLVETRAGWSVPGLLPGYPYAPSWAHGPGGRPMFDADHAAFLHTWHDRFEAELLYVSERALILDVPSPPQEPLAVAETAIEQYASAQTVTTPRPGPTTGPVPGPGSSSGTHSRTPGPCNPAPICWAEPRYQGSLPTC